MKTTKILLVAAVVGAASLTAHAGVRIGVSIGLPLPVPVVAVPVAPAPVVVATPACPPPVVSTAVVVSTPPCPGPGYLWVPGYWSTGPYGRFWVAGGWHYRSATVVVGRGYYGGYAHFDGRYGRTWR